ncbi:hypothetical protein BJX99DRAFT_234408 [Aspergillus californicus]
MAHAVENTNQGATDNQTKDNAYDGPRPHLASEALVDRLVLVWLAQTLFEKGEEHRDDDDALKALAENDEENLDGKDIDHDGEGAGWMKLRKGAGLPLAI